MDKEIKNKIIAKMNEGDGCPLCSTLLDHEFNQIAELQYAITFDEKVRREIADEGGFCDFHFRQFKKISSGKTNIIFLETIIETGNLRYDYYKNCRICKSVEVYEKSLIVTEHKLLESGQFKERFKNSLGLCFPHLRQLMIFGGSDLSNWLMEINIEQFKRALPDLREMAKVKSYFHIDKEKRKLINIIIEKLAGRKTLGL